MSVLATNRTKSKLKVYVNALALRKTMYYFILRDFGMKDKIRNVGAFSMHLEKEDYDTFQEMMTKYGVEKFKLEYPEWMISRFRDPIFIHLDDLIDNITHAYSIWPTLRLEYETRRNYINKAVGDCECLLKDLEKTYDILPIKAEKMMPYVEKIIEEIKLLKGWRKSDNQRFKNLK